ncbi:MAG: hypothetical protein MJ113_04315 [Lachnospiraceae bacterium]|nr:hypothetical protein [Lachnospiraceae bacterium]
MFLFIFIFILSGCDNDEEIVIYVPTPALQEETPLPTLSPAITPALVITEGVSTELTTTPCLTQTLTFTPSLTNIITPNLLLTPTQVPTQVPIQVPTLVPTSTPTSTLIQAPTQTPTPTLVPTLNLIDTFFSKWSFPYEIYLTARSVDLKRTTSSGSSKVDPTTRKIYTGDKILVTGKFTDSGKNWYNVVFEEAEYVITSDTLNYFSENYYSDKDFEFTIVGSDDTKYSYEDMEEDMYLLSEEFSDYFSYYSAGKSLDDRELYVITLGNPDAKKCIFVTATTHAREYQTTWLVMRMCEYYLKNMYTGFVDLGPYFYKNNIISKDFAEEGLPYDIQTYKTMLENMCFVIMPLLNPDGAAICLAESPNVIRNEELRNNLIKMYESDVLAYDSEKGFGIKSTLGKAFYYRRFKSNARGVDLNRNYPYGWEELDVISQPSWSTYKGETPFSEPETQVQKEVFEKLMEEKEICCVLSYHNRGPGLSWNIGQTGDFKTHCRNTANVLNYFSDYRVNLDGIKAYDLGGFSDWINHEMFAPSITIEIDYSNSYPPTVTQPERVWTDNRETWAGLAKYFLGR